MKLFLLAFVMGLCNWMHKMEIGYNTGYSIFEPVENAMQQGFSTMKLSRSVFEAVPS